jgi:hypothetical protein
VIGAEQEFPTSDPKVCHSESGGGQHHGESERKPRKPSFEERRWRSGLTKAAFTSTNVSKLLWKPVIPS